jgi:hypothetical protein
VKGCTPGPWVALRNNVIVARGTGGNQRNLFEPCWTDTQGRADGRLAAAAPELHQSATLLESLCTWLLHAHGPDSPTGKEAQFRLTQARAALTKAEKGTDA